MALSRIQAAASGTVMFWGAKISQKEPYVRTLPYILTISLASLDPSSIPAADSEPIVLKAVVERPPVDEGDEADSTEIILCTLRPHATNQVSVDFVLETDTQVKLVVEGKHELCVTGYFTIEEDQDEDIYGDLYGGEGDSDESEDFDDQEDGGEDDEDDDEEMIKEMKKLKQAPQAKKATQQPQQQQKQNQPTKGEEKKTAAKGGEEKNKKPNTKGEEESKKRKAEEGKGEEGNKKQKAAAVAAATAATAKVKKHPNGLIVEELKEGSGKEATKGAAVTIDYKGQLTSGKVFDSGKKLKFKVGRAEVIAGMEQGIAGMKVGGKRKLTIPASLGYGSQKIPGIPPNSTLVFTIDLVSSI